MLFSSTLWPTEQQKGECRAEHSSGRTTACKCAVAVVPGQDAHQQQQQPPNSEVPVPATKPGQQPGADSNRWVTYNNLLIFHMNLSQKWGYCCKMSDTQPASLRGYKMTCTQRSDVTASAAHSAVHTLGLAR